ncbi:hypothetical protein P2G42_13590 [Klebsiella electrica]|uniref:hypothetical protein n=1 Tax=Klebsiella electrica TaxID=1259973 RepID=UPI002555D6CC|nr:hypothetical protein [Klebsiella electrica]WIO45641.1 hypothetical protein P2G42_13590 [Klebsiella electrica]
MKFLMLVAPCAAAITKQTNRKVMNVRRKRNFMTKLNVISAASKAQTRTVLTIAARITLMTDITELAQREKFEAWAHSQKLSLAYGDCGYAFSSTEMAWLAWRASSPELVEALEKAQQRIAELESRTVNIKFAPIQVEELGSVRDGKKHPYMFGAGYNSAVIHCESVIQQELDAKGIKWEGE